MNTSRRVRMIMGLVCAIGGVTAVVLGHYVVGGVLVGVGLVLICLGPPAIGDLTGITGLPQGVSAADVKAYRRAHRGTTIAEAIRALGGDHSRDGVGLRRAAGSSRQERSAWKKCSSTKVR